MLRMLDMPWSGLQMQIFWSSRLVVSVIFGVVMEGRKDLELDQDSWAISLSSPGYSHTGPIWAHDFSNNMGIWSNNSFRSIPTFIWNQGNVHPLFKAWRTWSVNQLTYDHQKATIGNVGWVVSTKSQGHWLFWVMTFLSNPAGSDSEKKMTPHLT